MLYKAPFKVLGEGESSALRQSTLGNSQSCDSLLVCLNSLCAPHSLSPHLVHYIINKYHDMVNSFELHLYNDLVDIHMYLDQY